MVHPYLVLSLFKASYTTSAGCVQRNINGCDIAKSQCTSLVKNKAFVVTITTFLIVVVAIIIIVIKATIGHEALQFQTRSDHNTHISTKLPSVLARRSQIVDHEQPSAAQLSKAQYCSRKCATLVVFRLPLFGVTNSKTNGYPHQHMIKAPENFHCSIIC